jgi:hypothetical protein
MTRAVDNILLSVSVLILFQFIILRISKNCSLSEILIVFHKIVEQGIYPSDCGGYEYNTDGWWSVIVSPLNGALKDR